MATQCRRVGANLPLVVYLTAQNSPPPRLPKWQRTWKDQDNRCPITGGGLLQGRLRTAEVGFGDFPLDSSAYSINDSLGEVEVVPITLDRRPAGPSV